MALFTGGHCLITGVPGLAKTLLIKTVAEILASQLQAHPVHARPDAGRHHRHRDPRRGGRAPRAALPEGADLRADHPRRRDQPHAAEDAGRAARGDAGVSRHGRGPDLRARAAVLRARDAEPDRARRHVSAARGAARSLHVQRRHDLPRRRRTKCGSSRRRRARRGTPPERVLDGARHHGVSGERARSARRRRSRALRGAPGRQLAAGPRRQARVRRRSG